MSVSDQLSYEGRVRPRYAALAAIAAILLFAAAMLNQIGPKASVSELTVDLITANKRFGLDLIAAIINGAGSIALAYMLAFLYRMACARNPRARPGYQILPYVGGFAVAVSGIAYAIVIASKAHQFVTTGTQSYVEANHLTSTWLLLLLQVAGELAALLLTAAYVWTALNAMRVGLLTRFMGYLGVFAGVLVLLQITPVPVVQAYWLIALAVLMSGRWPNGTPRAWESGKAEPWPTGREVREQRMQATARQSRGRQKPAREPVATASQSSARSSQSSARASAKRKRKRRK